MEQASDISLVAKVAIFHDRKAFDLLVKKYQSPLRCFFLHHTLGDAQLSDDLAQDTFVKAYTRIASFRGTSEFSTWLYRIAYNVWYDYQRANKPTTGMEIPSVARMNADNGNANLRMDLMNALRILNENERTCITLQLMDGFSINQIEDVTGLAQGTIKSHLSRGKMKLASYLKQNGYDRKR